MAQALAGSAKPIAPPHPRVLVIERVPAETLTGMLSAAANRTTFPFRICHVLAVTGEKEMGGSDT